MYRTTLPSIVVVFVTPSGETCVCVVVVCVPWFDGCWAMATAATPEIPRAHNVFHRLMGFLSAVACRGRTVRNAPGPLPGFCRQKVQAGCHRASAIASAKSDRERLFPV